MAKTYTKTLSSGEDRLILIAEAIKTGCSVYAFHVKREGKTVVSKTRGGSQKFDTMAEGQKAVDAAVASAISAGWSEPTKRGGPAQPDTFTLTALPAPRKAEGPKTPEAPKVTKPVAPKAPQAQATK
jgi:hypothetical protein